MTEAKLTKEDVIKYIEEMPVLELAELVKELEDRFGVTAAAPMAMGVAPAASGATAAPDEEEQAEFDVVLTGFGDKKIQVIKAVREVTSLGLKEAKDLVEGVPQPVKEKIAKEEADKIKQKLEEAGGTAEIK
jgi:large subunit ribosomal protein L7/L12